MEIPRCYIQAKARIHIGGFDKCGCEDNCNKGCILQFCNLQFGENNKSLIAGECIFCGRIFAYLDWSSNREEFLYEIASLIKTNPELTFVFHPINQIISITEQQPSRWKIYKRLPCSHKLEMNPKGCTICNLLSIEDELIPIYQDNYFSLLYAKKCRICGNYFLAENTDLSYEFKKYKKWLQSLDGFVVHRAQKTLTWYGKSLNEGAYYGYDDKGVPFVSTGEILKDKVTIDKTERFDLKALFDPTKDRLEVQTGDHEIEYTCRSCLKKVYSRTSYCIKYSWRTNYICKDCYDFYSKLLNKGKSETNKPTNNPSLKLPSHKLLNDAELHIGGWNRCQSDHNPNNGCVLELYNAYNSDNGGKFFLVGKCVFCHRIFPSFNSGLKYQKRRLFLFKKLVENNPNLKFIFHPIAEEVYNVRRFLKNEVLHYGVPANHMHREITTHHFSGQRLKYRKQQPEMLRDSYLEVDATMGCAVIPTKECSSCNEIFTYPNVKLSDEFSDCATDCTYINEPFPFVPTVQKMIGGESLSKPVRNVLEIRDEIIKRAKRNGYIEADDIILNVLKEIKDIPVLLKPRTFLVRVDAIHCISKKHTLYDIVCLVNIARYYDVITIQIPAIYCDDCKKYYILEQEYNKYRKYGQFLCRVVHNDYFINYNEYSGFETFKEESVLHIMGYNVREYDGPTEEMRREILRNAVDKHVLSRAEICSHLESMIRLRSYNANMGAACDKWRTDINYIRNYKSNELERIKADIIIENRYNYK